MIYTNFAFCETRKDCNLNDIIAEKTVCARIKIYYAISIGSATFFNTGNRRFIIMIFDYLPVTVNRKTTISSRAAKTPCVFTDIFLVPKMFRFKWRRFSARRFFIWTIFPYSQTLFPKIDFYMFCFKRGNAPKDLRVS